MKVEKKIVAAFCIAFAAICLLGAIAYFDARALLSRNEWVIHTYQVLQKIDQCFQSLQNMELGGRGYLFTGQEDYLEPFHDGINSVATEMDELQRLTVDNAAQQRNIERFRTLVAESIAAMNARVAARKANDAAALQMYINAENKEQTDLVRAQTARMTAEEDRLLAQRTRASDESALQALTTFSLLLGLAIVMLIAFYIFIRHDLAERRRTAAALQESDRRFRGVMESAPDAMLISNAEGIIDLSNSQAARLFGYSNEELKGRPLSSLLLDRVAPLSDLVENEDDPVRLERERALVDLQARGAHFDGVRQDGERFPVDLSQSPLDSDHEHLTITAVRDRTEQQRAEDALRKFSLDLARSNAELERFAYVASHDLQEPLRMVSSYTQLLSKRYKGKLDANADEFIGYAVDGATRMQKLITDLLALSRVGTQARPSEPVDTKAVLSRVVADLQPAIEAAGATIHYPDEMPVVLADGGQIGQLFQNIIGNGLKFHGDGAPEIKVAVEAAGAEAGGEFWRFAIADNGIGIERQYFERIFVIFQRLHGKESYAGTGIGLAICKKIVERHGGKLWVESQPGVGTTFLFTLPAVPVQV